MAAGYENDVNDVSAPHVYQQAGKRFQIWTKNYTGQPCCVDKSKRKNNLQSAERCAVSYCNAEINVPLSKICHFCHFRQKFYWTNLDAKVGLVARRLARLMPAFLVATRPAIRPIVLVYRIWDTYASDSLCYPAFKRRNIVTKIFLNK